MAQKPSSSLGVVAASLGILIVGALAATPFYLSRLNPETRRLDTVLDDNITHIRRIIQNIDEHLGAMTDLATSLGDETLLDPDAVDRLVKNNPEIIPPSTLSDLKRSAQRLRDIDREHAERGTAVQSDKRIPAGNPNIKSSIYKMQNVLLTANTDLLQQADKVLRDLRTAGTDTLRADQHLGATRIRAILLYTQGRLERGRVALEHWRAARFLRHAESLVNTVAQCRRDAEVARARRPEESLDQLRQQIARIETAITQNKTFITVASDRISKIDASLKTLETAARSATARLVAMEASGDPIHEDSSEYRSWTVRLRQAEAEAAALRNGSLAGAVRSDDEAYDLLTAPYEGGERVPGLRDLLHAQALATETLAKLEHNRDRLLQRQTEMKALDRELVERAQTARRDADQQSSRITELLELAKARVAAAGQASGAAINHLNQAETFARSAIDVASARVLKARSAAPTSTGSEAERLKMITNDGDMEAALHVLIGEAAYTLAGIAADSIDALRNGFETESYIAEMTGRDPPEWPEKAVDRLRTAAVDQLAAANKAYENARRLISKTQAASAHGKILGRNYVWQIQVGMASVHLLRAAILADADAAHLEKVAAYNLLTEAAEGREQSPLLSHAIEAILYLQQNP